jgi:glyceraldehyde-3-phosphate dehydrogenase/erythrose-4-phosphate dehydrogenase
VIDGKLVRVLSWYDNEWGFSNRMIDTSGVVSSSFEDQTPFVLSLSKDRSS